MDNCLESCTKNRMRVETWLQRAVQMSVMFADGRGVWDKEGEGEGSIKKSRTAGQGFKTIHNNSSRS